MTAALAPAATVRRAGPADAAVLAELLAWGTRALPTATSQVHADWLSRARARMTGLLGDDNSVVLLAEGADGPEGCGVISRNGGRAYLSLFVARRPRVGVGRTLAEEALRVCRDEWLGRWALLEVFTENTAAVAFWEALGFVAAPTTAPSTSVPGAPMQLMVRAV